ncbi:MAG: hypothetical protein HYR94_18845, partial [Chloroflexi bacterium]|nr:hypothetical protein [Chloroflexota bacterium]
VLQMLENGQDEITIPTAWLQDALCIIADTPSNKVMCQFKWGVIAPPEFTAIGGLFVGGK